MSYDMRYKLLDEHVAQIKGMLWEGVSQVNIASLFRVSEVTISRIKSGRQRPDIMWPDGSYGPMPRDRVAQLITNRPETAQEILKDPKSYVKHEQTEQPPIEDNKDEAREWITELGNKAGEEMEDEFLQAISSDAEPDASDPITADESEPVYYEKEDWDKILNENPENQLVILGQVDERFREAVCIVFKSFPESQWNSEPCFNLCKKISLEVLDHPVEYEFNKE